MHTRETHPTHYFISGAAAQQFADTRQTGLRVIHTKPSRAIQGEYERNGIPRKLTDLQHHRVTVSWF